MKARLKRSSSLQNENYSMGQASQDNHAIVFDCQMICPANLRSIVCASDSGLGDRKPLIWPVAAITSIQIFVIANIDYWSEFGEDLDLFQASEIQVWKGKGFDHSAWSSLYQ